MILQMFSIFDSKALAYLPPFCMRARGEALRAFMTTLEDPTTQMHKHPGDYTLLHLGAWDDTTGKFNIELNPENLGNGRELGQPAETATDPETEE